MCGLMPSAGRSQYPRHTFRIPQSANGAYCASGQRYRGGGLLCGMTSRPSTISRSRTRPFARGILESENRLHQELKDKYEHNFAAVFKENH
jgi:hypothetical protein